MTRVRNKRPFPLADELASDEKTLTEAIAASSDATTIEITADILLTSSLSIPAAKTITLIGDHSLSGPDGQDTITVASSGNLTIDGITVTHQPGAEGCGLHVRDNAVCVMNSGKITANKHTAGTSGGGVLIDKGSFTLTGGDITENYAASYGAGVYTAGAFTMSGGRICGNESGAHGGGVYCSSTGNFRMTGGEISGNTAKTANGGGVSDTGSFEMTGGIITGNTAAKLGGGADISNNGQFTLDGGKITLNTSHTGGGGVHSARTFAMKSGEISGNRVERASAANTAGGGGVYSEGAFTMDNGVISSNSDDGMSSDGGGGVMNKGVFTMNGGAIMDNTAARYGGGVISEYSSANRFTLNSGIITGNAAGFGGGGVAVSTQCTFTMNSGEITGNTAGTNGGGVYTGSVSTGFRTDINGGVIEGNRAGTDGGGIFRYAGPVSISGSARVTGNTAQRNGGGVYVACDALSSLTVGPAVTFAGNSASQSFARRPQDDSVYASNVLASSWSYPFTQGYNGYDIAYTCTNPNPYSMVTVAAVKITQGAPVSAGQFSFGLYDGASLVYSAVNDADGNVRFPRLPLSQGVYTLTMRELPHGASGWTTDDAEKQVQIEVGASGDWTILPDSAVTFSNTYAATPVSVGVNANLSSPDGQLEAGRFTFGLFDSDGTLVATAENDGSGAVSFPGQTFTHAGVYDWQIRQLTPSGDGWTTDAGVFPVRITVSDNAAAQLSASVSYPEGAPVFENNYEALPAMTQVTAVKNAFGAQAPEGRFQFGLFDAYGNLIATAANALDGSVTFPPVPEEKAITSTYTVRELTPDGGGWTCEGAVSFPVTAVVTDDGTGQMNSDVSYPGGTPSFTDRYSAAPSSETVYAMKKLIGWSGDEIPFEFGLFDQGGNLVAGANNLDGVARFPQITYSSPGTYSYTVRETSTPGNGWTTDSRSFPVTVSVSDDAAGSLVCAVSYPDGTPAFTDTYEAEPASVSLTATKAGEGAPAPAGQFSFGVFDRDGNPVAAAVNAADGSVSFPELLFSGTGSYEYFVRETTSSGNGWICDTDVYPVRILVTDDQSGHMVAVTGYPEGQPVFVNRHAPEPAVVAMGAAKAVHGAPVPQGGFSFAVFDAGGAQVASAVSGSDGDVAFTPFEIDTPGVYSYTMRETGPSSPGWTADTSVFPISVLVSPNDSGQLTATLSYPQGRPVFVNTFSGSGEAGAAVRAFKAVRGACLKAGMFTFGMFDMSGNEVARATNDACGDVVFPALPPGSEGVHEYSVRELNASGPCWTNDGRSYPVRVTVSPGSDGLEASVSYPMGSPVFVNRHAAGQSCCPACRAVLRRRGKCAPASARRRK